jgi:hypothetical protein
VQAQEKKPMEPNQAFLSISTPVALPAGEIPAFQVWMNLTRDQQARLLRAIVLICREVVLSQPQMQEREVADD